MSYKYIDSYDVAKKLQENLENLKFNAIIITKVNIISVDIWLKRIQVNSVNIDTDSDSWAEAFSFLVSPLLSVKTNRVRAHDLVSKVRSLHPVFGDLLEAPESIVFNTITIESSLHTFNRRAEHVLSRSLTRGQSRTAVLMLSHSLPRIAAALLEPWGHEAHKWLLGKYLEVIMSAMGGDREEIERLLPYSGLVPVSETNGFVGRASELGRVCDLLIEGFRIVTITGPGGIGKTRLAKESVPGSVKSVNLKLATDAAHLSDAIRGTIDLRLEGAVRSGASTVEALAKHLPELLVLDNADLLDSKALVMLQDLQEAAPDCQFVVTSRKPLGLPGEAEVNLAPLTEQESLALIDHFAKKHGKSGGVQTAELLKLAAGNPLALEQGVAGGLLEALPPHLERLMASLATFASSWSHEEAEAVLGYVDELHFGRLADASLIRLNSVGRYYMMDPTRERARRFQAPDLRAQHAGYFEALALQKNTEKLEAAPDEVWAALSFLSDSGDGERFVAMVVAVTPWARSSGRLATLEIALKEAAGKSIGPKYRAEVVDALGRLLLTDGRFSESVPMLSEAMEYWERSDDLLLTGRAAGNLVAAYGQLRQFAQAESLARKAVHIFRRLEDALRLAQALNNLGQILGELYRYEDAAQVQLEALRLDGTPVQVARRFINIAETYLHLSKKEEALKSLDNALELSTVPNLRAEALTLQALLSDSIDIETIWQECLSLDAAPPFWNATKEIIELRLR